MWVSPIQYKLLNKQGLPSSPACGQGLLARQKSLHLFSHCFLLLKNPAQEEGADASSSLQLGIPWKNDTSPMEL